MTIAATAIISASNRARAINGAGIRNTLCRLKNGAAGATNIETRKSKGLRSRGGWRGNNAMMLRLKDAAARYAVSISTLRRMMDEGYISGERTPGGHRRINQESADNYFTRSDRWAEAVARRIVG